MVAVVLGASNGSGVGKARRFATNGAYRVLKGTFQGYEGRTVPSENVAIIARRLVVHNGLASTIHRFHKCGSCVFHIIHRFWAVFGMPRNPIVHDSTRPVGIRPMELSESDVSSLTGGKSDAYIGATLRRSWRSSRRTSEAHLSAKRPQEGENTRISCTDVHARRTRGSGGSSPQGQEDPERIVLRPRRSDA
jgi:hypothetical protein